MAKIAHTIRKRRCRDRKPAPYIAFCINKHKTKNQKPKTEDQKKKKNSPISPLSNQIIRANSNLWMLLWAFLQDVRGSKMRGFRAINPDGPYGEIVTCVQFNDQLTKTEHVQKQK